VGLKTEELMAACKDAVKKIAEAQQGVDDQLKTMNNAVKRVEGLPNDADPKVLDKGIEGCVTERTFTRGAISTLAKRVETADASAQELADKVKSKGRLNAFKTQKSLDEAKKVLTSAQQAVAAGKKKLTASTSGYNGLDLKIENQSDRITNLVKDREGAASAADKVVKALQRFQTNTLAGAIKVYKNVGGTLDQHRKDLAKNQAELKGRKTWSERDKAARLAELRTDFTELETIQKQLDDLVNNVKVTRDKIDTDPVKTNPDVKQAMAKAALQENAFQAAATKAREDALNLATDVKEVQNDMDLVVLEGQGGDARAEARAVAADAAADNLERMAVTLADSPTLEVFKATLDDIKRDTPFLGTGLPNGARWVPKDWEKFDSIARTIAANEKLVGSQYPSLLRNEKQAQAIFNRFKDHDRVKEQWDIAKRAAAEKKKQYADLQKVLPQFKGLLAKLLAVHP
jgi:hypothetical protein